jgi:threonine dehydrogenase-like Zn-dependent dehydrogenase
MKQNSRKLVRTVTYDKPGSVSFIDTELPLPGYGEVLVQMKACGICKYDIKTCKNLNENPAYSARPGHEGVGVVEAVGEGVTNLKPGDKVASIYLGGAMAGTYLADLQSIARLPDSVSRYELWFAEPITCVVAALRLLRIEPGENVVLIGSGYMGVLILQGLPKSYLHNLIVLEPIAERRALAEKYGAGVVLDPVGVDVIEAVRDILGGEADTVIEASGEPGTIESGTSMLRNGGKLCIFGHHAKDEVAPTNAWHMQGIHVLNTTPFMSQDFHRDLVDAVHLMDRGVYDQYDLITHIYPFDDAPHAIEETTAHPEGMIKSVLKNY